MSISGELVAHPGPPTGLVEIDDLDAIRVVMERAIARWHRGVSPQTERARNTDLRLFAEHFDTAAKQPWQSAMILIGANDPDDADIKVGLWVDAMKSAGHRNTSVARRVSTLRSLCKSLRTNREVRLRWELSVAPPKFDAYNNAEGPSVDAVHAAIAEVHDKPRELLALLLMFDLGLRVSEALSLTVGGWLPDRSDNGAIRFIRKGGSEVVKTVTQRVRDALDRRLFEVESINPGTLWIGVSDTSVRQWCHALGLGSPHGLRHTGATELYRATKDLSLVQQHLGHRNIATTQIYLDQVEDAAGRAARILSGEESPD